MEIQAIDAYTKAVEFFERKDFSSAHDVLLSIIKDNSQDFDAFNLLGMIKQKQGNLNEAVEYFQKATSIFEPNPIAHYNLGLCYQSLENLELAKKHFERSLVYSGCDLRRKGEIKESEKYFDKISGDKNYKAILFTNLGVERMGKGYLKEAVEYFDIALEFSQVYPEIHYNKSHALLISGNFKEGWKEYEWRKKRKDYYPREFSKPELKPGISVQGKKILVFDEQGLGDAIQFVRYLPKLKEAGAEIILECNKLLAQIFKCIPDISSILERRIDHEPTIEYDYQIPLLSLPLYFNTTLETISFEAPYIFAEKDQTIKMSQLIGSKDKFKIGIVWGGSPTHTGNGKRSIPISLFEKLLSIENVKLFSLQKGAPLKQTENINFPIVILNKYLTDFADTAAAIENMDLVVTIDTSVAHLAGAMGKPVWLLLPYFPDWRWMLNRNDSPWYPTMKLFRQKEEGDWNAVFDEVSTELNFLLKNKNFFNRKSEVKNKKLFLGLSGSGDFGWGTVNKYLKQEVSKRIEVYSIEENGIPSQEELKEVKVFQLLRDLDFNPLFEVSGKENFGYTVFENELNECSYINSKNYNKIIAASNWGRDKLLEAGISNADCIIQGIDTKLFFPEEQKRNDNLFVIFSGGKLELRKGQDLVLKAISILQKKYKDIVLITAWYNLWLESARLMSLSKYIKYEERGSTWQEFMNHIYLINDVDPSKVITMPLVPNQKLRELYLKSDIGLFPNRCEGGTNLVMMEYMACGKPVIASFNTGHKDVLTEFNSLPLKQMKSYRIFNDEQKLVSDWEEPNLDEIISKIEYAYNHRYELKIIGNEAAKSMMNFTWAKTAENLLKVIGFNVDDSEASNSVEALVSDEHKLKKLSGLKPQDYLALAVNLKKSGNIADAEKYYLKAIELNPEFWEAFYNLGILYHENGKVNLAVDCYKESIRLKPDFYLSHSNLGSAYRELSLFNLACESYKKSIQLNPSYSDAHYNLGVVNGFLYNYDEAMNCYNNAITVDASHVNAHWNKSLLLLASGNFDEGFREYEWRMKRKEFSKRDFKCPQLKDQNIFNKNVVVYAEQGFGDAIQFARYLPMLKNKGCNVTLACDSLLLDLFKFLNGIDKIVLEEEALKNQNEFDFNISLLSLPYYFKTTLETIPSAVPYIKVSDIKIKEWKKILKNDDNFKIGLVWGGNPKHGKDDNRSIPLEDFSILSSLKDVKLFSLQKGKPLKQIENCNFNIENLSAIGQNSFVDTAAIIENLDLVISVDTSVAHLAGAVGKPIWTLLQYDFDWRWMKDRNDSPWYPSMKLFRQKAPGDWKSVIYDIVFQLNEILSCKNFA